MKAAYGRSGARRVTLGPAIGLMLLLAACGTPSAPGRPPASRVGGGDGEISGADQTTASGTPLPFGLTTGTVHVAVSGGSEQTFDLTEVSSTSGAVMGAAQGPGYNFWTTDGNGLVLRLPPTGSAGAVFTSGTLMTPVDVEVDLQNTTQQIFTSGNGSGTCTVTLSHLSATAIGGKVSCTGIKESSTPTTADVDATFELTA